MPPQITKLRHLFHTIRTKRKAFACAPFSSQAALDVKEQPCYFRTTENNPIHHSLSHIAKFYQIPADVKGNIFFSGGVPKSLDILMKTFRENCVMVREPAIEIMSLLKNMDYSNPAVRFVLYGKFGTGKTLTLTHIVHFGFKSKYLLIHSPWVSNWTKRPKEKVPSQFKEGRIDLPVESALWLQHFKHQNLELLNELKMECSQSYTWSKREVTEKGSPITDILEHGITRVRHSPDCLGALLKEIKYHSQFGKFKSLVVVDGVNAFYSKTNVQRADKSLVDASDISIVRAFQKLLQCDWNNAAVVTSVDTLPHNRDSTMHDPCTPHVLLGKEGFELLDPFIPVETKNFSDIEVESAIDYYIDRMWLTPERIRGEAGRKQLKFLSGHNPFMLMKLCEPL